MINPESTIMFQIREVSLKMDRFIKSQYPIFDHDHSHPHVSKLQGMAAGYLIMNDDKEIFQRDLERAMSISKSTASGLVGRMVKNGIIETSPSSHDARYKRLMLTPETRKHMCQIDQSAKLVEASLSKGVSAEDMAVFHKVLKQISDNAE